MRLPAGFDGRGACIALVQVGRGIETTDLRAYFRRLRLDVPHLDVARINDARNRRVGRPGR